MLKKLLLGLFFASQLSMAQEYSLIWEENFNGYQIPSGVEGNSDGDATSNAWFYMGDYNASFTKWTIDASNASLQNFSDYAAVFRTDAYVDPHFRVQDTHGNEITTPEGGFVSWITETIDISTKSNVSVSLFIGEEGDHEDNDYVDIYYSTDGGNTFTRIENWKNLGNATHTLVGDTAMSATCNIDVDFQAQTVQFAVPDAAESLVIRVSFKNGASSENFIMDDVKVYGTEASLSVADHTIGKISMYPNPTENQVSFTANNRLESIQIYGINGSLVRTVNAIGQMNYSMDVSDLSQGIYFVKIQSANQGERIKKLIIQ